MGNIRAIIFDWGGVLIEDPSPGRTAYCCLRLGCGAAEFDKVTESHIKLFQTGTVTEGEFWQAVCEDLGVPKPGTPLWGKAMRDAYQPRPKMFDLVRSLRSTGYKTALLSNTEIPVVEIFNQFSYDMFNTAVFSCCEGHRKPDPAIYELTLHRLGIGADNALFVDDQADAIRGAQQVGIRTIHFMSYMETLAGLRAVGIKPGTAVED